MDMPSSTNNEPIKVKCAIELLDINRIDAKDFGFSINVALEINWKDNRITFPNDKHQGQINVDFDFSKKIWTPDFYFYDLKRFRTLENFDGEPQGGLRVGKNITTNETEVTYMVEAEIIFTCPIDYSEFPFHVATCKLRLTSYNERNTSMVFSTDLNNNLPGYVMRQEKIRGYNVNVSYLTGEDTYVASWSNPDAWYSVVGIKIDLVSRYRKYIFVYFIPTIMFTFTSWVSYLLPPTSYPARTSLLITVFLCQVGIFTAAIKDTPNYDGGMTDLELWCFANITCTFGALLSYVIILMRMECIRKKINSEESKDKIEVDSKRDLTVELLLFGGVAGLFALFNICFWSMKKSAL